MCGIAGIVRLDGRSVQPHEVDAMTSALHHRGPDDRGLWTSGPVGLGHTRLAIIDLADSTQPMTSADANLHLVFNGEILNYRQLRSASRYPYRTSGDTETLLAMHAEHGDTAPGRLRGQFAYALHDAARHELLLVRDRLGILPLFYYRDERVFAFASEIKALLPLLGQVRVDEESLSDYLAHRAVPAPFTLIAGVRKLLPGHVLRIDTASGAESLRPYWSLPTGRPVPASPDEAVRRVGEALEASVTDALVADVPVGAYLSGGVDSSLITALVARARDGAGVRTYAAGFGDPRVDELSWARQVADHLGTEHREVVVTADDFAELWPRLSWHRDAPLSEPADVAVFRLAEAARRDVTVVLSGEGSDELFAGYPKYRAARTTELAALVPAAVREPMLGRLEQALPARLSRMGIALRAAAAPTAAERMRTWFAPFTVSERDRLLGGRPARQAGLAAYESARGDVVARMLRADAQHWLADNLLERGDRMSMAASLELRPPFLDHRLVELAFSLPSALKVRGGTTKWVVKEVARRYLPSAVVDRPKAGFRVPLDSWFRNGLREMSWDLLAGPGSFVADAFDRRAVQDLLQSHGRGRRDEQKRLWTLLSLEVWHREFVRSAPSAVRV